MIKGNKNEKHEISYWHVFQIIIVVFFLFLIGDVLYRWDGFRYYASFSEFLPNIAPLVIFWSIIAVIISLLMWLLFRVFERVSLFMGWKIKIEALLLYMCIVLFFGAVAWIGKRYIWKDMHTSFQLKLIVILCVMGLAFFITRLLHHKSEKWIGNILQRINPMVWLFGSVIAFSVILLPYKIFWKQPDRVVSYENVQRSDTDNKRPNIILVIFDAMTARDMSLYGYQKQTTPFISEWAKDASVFSRVEAMSNFTTPAVASLMTGKRLWTHQTYHLRGSKPEKVDSENMPLLLKKNGYYNMAFVVNQNASVNILGIENSFEIAPLASEYSAPNSLFGGQFGKVKVLLYRFFGDKIRWYDWILNRRLMKSINKILGNITKTTVPPEKTFNKFLIEIDRLSHKPFFAWIHVLPPHDPYLPPEPYLGMFNDLDGKTESESQWTINNDRSYAVGNQSSNHNGRARYDEFIRYCDKQFKDFIMQLEKRGKLNDTVIIFTSDHGESFRNNYAGHGGPHLYEQVTHVPLIIKKEGQDKGEVFDVIVEHIDVTATILDLAMIPIPSWIEGRSLLPLMRGERFPSKPVFSMNFQKNFSRGHQITKGTIAVWDGDYKLINYLEENRSLLFNLKKDPGELNNLIDEEPEKGRRLLELVKVNLKKANKKIIE